MHSASLALSTLLVLLSSATTVCAQDAEAEESTPPAVEQSAEQQQAQIHFAAGRNHFELGQYEQALAEFTAAYELSGQPGLLYNLYLSNERLGDLQSAAQHLEEFLPHAGDEEATLRRRLENIRERLAAQTQQEQERQTREAEQQRLLAEERARATEGGGKGGISAGAITGFSVGGAGLVTFGVFALLSMLENSDLAETCGEDALMNCSDDDVSSLQTFNLVADIGLGVAAAGAITGLLFLLLDSGSDTEQAQAVGPWLAPDGGGVNYRGHF